MGSGPMVDKVFYYFLCKTHGVFSVGVSVQGETPPSLKEANCPICGALSPRDHLRFNVL